MAVTKIFAVGCGLRFAAGAKDKSPGRNRGISSLRKIFPRRFAAQSETRGPQNLFRVFGGCGTRP
jgi:hypothetical protein